MRNRFHDTPPNTHARSANYGRARPKAILALCLLGATLPSIALSGTFADNFSAGVDPTFWSITQTTTGLYSADLTQGNLHFAKTAMHNPGGLQNIAANLNLAALGGNISNDFSAQVHFTTSVLPGPSLDEVQLNAYFQDGAFFCDVRCVWPNVTGESNVHEIDNADVEHGAINTTATDGTFVISRVGSTLYFYFNGALMYSTSESSPLVRLTFILQNNVGADDATAVTFDYFSLTGPSVTIPVQILAPHLAADGSFSFGVPTAPPANGQSYSVLTNADLRTTNWGLYTNFIGNGTTIPVNAPARNAGQMFFRVRSP